MATDKLSAIKLNLFLFACCLLITNIAGIRVCDTFAAYDLQENPKCHNNPDGESNITEIIRGWNFTAEEHYLQTDDGYKILMVRAYKKIRQHHPIVLGHGIVMNGLVFVSRGHKSLPYILGNLGYDVWIINYRGTKYSRGHVNLTTKDPAYWSYSYYQVAIYDLRKALNYVHDKTHQPSIFIGYSMSTTLSYVYSIMFVQESQKLLKGIISLAPTVYFEGSKSLLQTAVLFRPLVYLLWHGEFLPRNNIMRDFCTKNAAEMKLCEFFKGPIFGFDFSQMDPVDLPVMNSQAQDSIGMEVVVHYTQNFKTSRFQAYDFGPSKNLKKYGQIVAPLYRLSKIRVPIVVYVGLNDPISMNSNVKRLYNELHESARCGYNIVKYENWAHLDFIQAKDIVKYLFNPILSSISHLEKGVCKSK